MTKHTTIALFLTAALFVPATGFAKVKTQFDPDMKIPTDQTYAWTTEENVDAMPDTIRAAMEDQFAELGLELVEENADLLVNVEMSAVPETRVHVTEVDPFFYNRRWHRRAWPHELVTVDTYDVTAGHFQIEIIDHADGETVWSGEAEGLVRKSPEKNAKKAAKTLKKMFRDFPIDPPAAD